jgi:transcription elongation GreA/GreB family factor
VLVQQTDEAHTQSNTASGDENEVVEDEPKGRRRPILRTKSEDDVTLGPTVELKKNDSKGEKAYQCVIGR